MATTHFLVLPTSNEVFSWHGVETKSNQIISQHKNLRLALDKAKWLNVESAATALEREARNGKPRCGYVDDRYPHPWGAGPRSLT